MSQQRWAGFLDRFIEAVAYWFTTLAALGLAAMMVNTVVSVVLRNVFASGMRGSDELSIYLLIWAGYCAMPYALFRNRHVIVDVLVTHVPGRVRYWILVIALVSSTGLTGLLTYGFIRYAYASVLEREVQNWSVIFPVWPARVIVATTFALLAISFFVVMGRHIAGRGAVPTPPTAPSPE